MKAAFILFFMTVTVFAARFPEPSVAKYDNNTAIEKAFDVSSSTVYKNSSLSSSTDPFAAKTNKYAETGAILVTCSGAGAHIKFGSSAPTAATTDFYIPVNTPTVFKINENKAFVALIENAASAVCYTVELR